jgi:hypothetical protein
MVYMKYHWEEKSMTQCQLIVQFNELLRLFTGFQSFSISLKRKIESNDFSNTFSSFHFSDYKYIQQTKLFTDAINYSRSTWWPVTCVQYISIRFYSTAFCSVHQKSWESCLLSFCSLHQINCCDAWLVIVYCYMVQIVNSSSDWPMDNKTWWNGEQVNINPPMYKCVMSKIEEEKTITLHCSMSRKKTFCRIDVLVLYCMLYEMCNENNESRHHWYIFITYSYICYSIYNNNYEV